MQQCVGTAHVRHVPFAHVQIVHAEHATQPLTELHSAGGQLADRTPPATPPRPLLSIREIVCLFRVSFFDVLRMILF
jgi:hypothetical protein